MVQIYIKHTDNNFYLLDLEPNEAINFKLTVKDLSDITKIFSPFTQSFKIKATDKNKILCGFIGNEKTLKVSNTSEFDAMIYVAGFLFQSGKLTFEETNYNDKEQKEFSTTFASTVSGLAEKLGDATVQDLFKNEDGSFDPKLDITWNTSTLKSGLQGITNLTLANGLPFSWGIPFISNIRTWLYGTNLNQTDNIAYNQFRKNDTENFIKLSEVRPAVTYATILKQLIKKYDLNVICPILERPEVADLYAYCNSESLVIPDAKALPIVNYGAITYIRANEKNDPGGSGVPDYPRYEITVNSTTGYFKIKRQNAAHPEYFKEDIFLDLFFDGLITKSAGKKIKVNVVRNDGIIINSQEIENGNFQFNLKDGMLDSNGELFFRYEIFPIDLVDWNSIRNYIVNEYRHEYKRLGIKSVERVTFVAEMTSNTTGLFYESGKINLITCLPKMKAIDFLKSFFKTFNIYVLSAGRNDQSMHWITVPDIASTNLEYSKRIVDYTQFTDTATLTKKKASQYNQYSFSHFDSKYYESVYGDGTRFGSLIYPTTPPPKPTKFEVKTDYSILKQSATFNHNSVNTCLGFSKEDPTVQDNGGNRYKPVYDEFTIFYLKFKGLGYDTVSCEANDVSNYQVLGILEADFANYTNGKSLSFGADGYVSDSLYLNYYANFIELLLKPNTYQSSFVLNLPPNEIFLNFSNTAQNESNIPTGFRAQNEIIIGEQRYQLVDSSIDLVTGKTKLNLLNF